MSDCSTSECVGRFPSVASSSNIFICHLRCFPPAGTLGSCCQFARKHGGHPARRTRTSSRRKPRAAESRPRQAERRRRAPRSRPERAPTLITESGGGGSAEGPEPCGAGGAWQDACSTAHTLPALPPGRSGGPSRSVERKTARSQPKGSLFPQHPSGALAPPKASAQAQTAVLDLAAGIRRGALPRPPLGGHGSGEPRRRAVSG